MPWRSASGDEPPVGAGYIFMSDNVEVLMDDDTVREGYFDRFTKEWWAIDDDDNFVMTDSVVAWREYKE